jgi:transcription initiation factor TFIID subunit 2
LVVLAQRPQVPAQPAPGERQYVKYRKLEPSSWKINAHAQFADGHFVATIVAAIGNAFCAMNRNDPAEFDLLRQAEEGLNRIVTMDRLVPSYQNLVTQAGLKVRPSASVMIFS